MGKVLEGASSFWERADRRTCQEKWQTYDTFPIAKTLKRETRFQEERYLSSDDVCARVTGQEFQIKSRCRASMSTQDVHNQEVNLQLSSGDVLSAKCTCKAGKSSYCNHVMSLLIEITDYYLHQQRSLKKQHVLREQGGGGSPERETFLKSQYWLHPSKSICHLVA